MKDPRHHREAQQTTVYSVLLLFGLLLLLVQLWLFVGVLEGLLSGKHTMAIPAAGFSLLFLGINVWMLVGVNRVDRKK